MKRFAAISIFVLACACGGDKEEAPKETHKKKHKEAKETAKETPPDPPKETPKQPPKGGPAEKPTGSGPGPNTPMVADAPEGNPPPDGKYEKVMVDGVTVPMIEVRDNGTTVLVDTDGKKPRSWEEQYKKKKATKKGQLDIHKTDVNKNGKFEDDPVDKEGIWLLDVKGNITKH